MKIPQIEAKESELLAYRALLLDIAREAVNNSQLPFGGRHRSMRQSVITMLLALRDGAMKQAITLRQNKL